MSDPGGPTISARLIDGPLSGKRIDVLPVEGRPPKTIDVDSEGNGQSRYCLAEWEQAGHSAVYSYLYEV